MILFFLLEYKSFEPAYNDTMLRELILSIYFNWIDLRSLFSNTAHNKRPTFDKRKVGIAFHQETVGGAKEMRSRDGKLL